MVLVAIGIWYVAVAIVTALFALAVWVIRTRNAKVATTNLEASNGHLLTEKQRALTTRLGQLDIPQSSYLRVVGLFHYEKSQEYLVDKFQLERAETITTIGHLVCGRSLADTTALASAGIEHVIYVTHDNFVLGEIPRVDTEDWFAKLLALGGAAECKLVLKFSNSLELNEVRVGRQAPVT